jgi:phosphohistidine phosphatase SixA
MPGAKRAASLPEERMIVFVLRHADKRLEPNADDLTELGVKRAALLGRMLAESGVTVAFCSTAVRARRTLEPLKSILGAGLTIRLVAIGANQPQTHVDTIVEGVKQLTPDQVVVVVTHSNTVSPIIQGLGGEAVGDLDDRVFDRLFVLSRKPATKPRLLRLRYGEPTPA